MTREEIKQNLIKVLSNNISENKTNEYDYENINIIDEYDIDSLTFISIIIDLEHIFNVIIPDDLLQMDEFSDFNNIVNILDSLLNIQNN